MNIVLMGFMGTGKTAVGRRLAEDLHADFVDVDDVIEHDVGRSVRAIFESEGEAVFRALEARAIEKIATLDGRVISTGGGALLNPINRAHLEKNGRLVCLRAKTGTLLDRLKNDLSRPLLAGEDREARVERLQKERQAIYDSCSFQIETDGKTIPEVAAEIARAIGPAWTKR